MIFDQIIIQNLFSYYGKQVFDLTGATPNKNIVLIFGRNGHGKTNFLNSLKLLFCGSDDGPLLQIANIYGKTKGTFLSSKKFIDGSAPSWEGIRNRQAVRQGLDDYSISVEWHEGKKHIIARRSWPISLRSRAGELDIQIDGERLHEENASKFLEDRLPKELVPYFHFDGELIRDLAEANESTLMTSQVERLLELRRIIDLRDQCQTVLKEFQKQYAREELINNELDLEAKKSARVAKRYKCERLIEDLMADIQETDTQLVKIDRELQSIFNAGSIHDEESLKKQQQEAKERLEDACQRFIDSTFDLPLCINPELSKRVINRLSEISRDKSNEQKALLAKLKRVLPEELFGLPPYPSPRLSASQEKFFIDKLKNLFTKMTDGFDSGTTLKISLEKMSELHEDFINAVTDAKKRQSQAAEVLRQIKREKERIEQIEDKLLEAGGLGQRARERYDRLINERSELEHKKLDKSIELNKEQDEIKRIDNDIIDLDKALNKVRREIEFATRGERKVDLLAKSIKALDTYRVLMRDRYRKDIEKRVNELFFQILDSFDLIDHIKLNDDFIPEYYDVDNRQIGRLSVSAGTKQLLATAYLWALKEVSKKTVPVVVDTPLARIDRRHQENLINKFYPSVSEQVIILPTDSELDKEKYYLLKEHIYREYSLENPTGMRTIVKPNHMYE